MDRTVTQSYNTLLCVSRPGPASSRKLSWIFISASVIHVFGSHSARASCVVPRRHSAVPGDLANSAKDVVPEMSRKDQVQYDELPAPKPKLWYFYNTRHVGPKMLSMGFSF